MLWSCLSVFSCYFCGLGLHFCCLWVCVHMCIENIKSQHKTAYQATKPDSSNWLPISLSLSDWLTVLYKYTKYWLCCINIQNIVWNPPILLLFFFQSLQQRHICTYACAYTPSLSFIEWACPYHHSRSKVWNVNPPCHSLMTQACLRDAEEVCAVDRSFIKFVLPFCWLLVCRDEKPWSHSPF